MIIVLLVEKSAHFSRASWWAVHSGQDRTGDATYESTDIVG